MMFLRKISIFIVIMNSFECIVESTVQDYSRVKNRILQFVSILSLYSRMLVERCSTWNEA